MERHCCVSAVGLASAQLSSRLVVHRTASYELGLCSKLSVCTRAEQKRYTSVVEQPRPTNGVCCNHAGVAVAELQAGSMRDFFACIRDLPQGVETVQTVAQPCTHWLVIHERK